MIKDLQRFGAHIPVQTPVGSGPGEVIPVLHRWIQSGALQGVLIDVADYSHVPDGPGVLLVAHEGNWSVQLRGDSPGLSYVRKTPQQGSLAERIAGVVREALRAAALLEAEESLEIRFRVGDLTLFANDRLRAPNDRNTFEALGPAFQIAMTPLFPEGLPTPEWTATPPARFGITLPGLFGASIEESYRRLKG